MRVTWKDGAPEIVCAAPVMGTYQTYSPEGSYKLDIFNGMNTKGSWEIWTLLFGNGIVSGGRLLNWKLTLCYDPTV